MNPLSRHDYVQMETAELERRLASVRDRMERAITVEAALADAYTEQELSAAISMKEEAQ